MKTGSAADGLRVLRTEADLALRVSALARAIDAQASSETTLLGILTAAIPFASDLRAQITAPVEVEFVRVATQFRDAGLVYGPPLGTLRGRHVVIVDCIVDTGRTVQIVQRYLEDAPRNVQIVALLDRPANRNVAVAPDLVGYTLDTDKYIVGYGLDYRGQYRHLRTISTIERPPPRLHAPEPPEIS